MRREDHDKVLDVWSKMMDYQRSHREYFYYSRSRFFVHIGKDSQQEDWMFLDEYERRED